MLNVVLVAILIIGSTQASPPLKSESNRNVDFFSQLALCYFCVDTLPNSFFL